MKFKLFKKERHRPARIKRTHDLWCDCRKCERPPMAYWKDILKDNKGA